jgi:hypothetical protein
VNSTDEKLKSQLVAEAEAAIVQMLKERKPTSDITLTEIERLARQVGQRMAAAATEVLVAASEDEQDVGFTCEKCQRRLRYKGKKRRRVVTENGEVTIERVYYYCEGCESGFFPPG